MPNWITDTITEKQTEILRRLCHFVNPINRGSTIKILEIGTFTGHSTSVFADFVKREQGTFYTCDWFKGSHNTGLTNLLSGIDMYTIFLINMREMNLEDNINIFKMKSEECANILQNDYFDLIFIDGDHTYNGIKKDLDLFLPKIKKNGIMCGHDFETPYEHLSKFDKDFIMNNIDQDMVHLPEKDLSVHGGVIKAVFEKFHTVNFEEKIWWTIV